MAKKAKPILKVGLSPKALLSPFHKGILLDGATHYTTGDDLVLENIGRKAVLHACELLTEHVDAGGVVGRKQVIALFSNLDYASNRTKDWIRGQLTNGEFAPNILDKLASI